MDRTDPQLVEACLGGDEAAWSTLVDRYVRLVYSIPRRYGFDDADADDVTQIVFTRLFRRLDALRDQTRLSSWLITTAHRECWRLHRRRPPTESLPPALEAEPAPDDAQRWERQHLVRVALDELGEPCRSLLAALFAAEGEGGYRRVAARLGLKVGSIGPTRARCFRKLQAILEAMGVEAGVPGRVDRE